MRLTTDVMTGIFFAELEMDPDGNTWMDTAAEFIRLELDVTEGENARSGWTPDMLRAAAQAIELSIAGFHRRGHRNVPQQTGPWTVEAEEEFADLLADISRLDRSLERVFEDDDE